MAKQARKKGKSAAEVGDQLALRLRESVFLLSILAAVYLLLSLFTYDPGDPGPSNSVDPVSIQNIGGQAGAWIADALLYFSGYLAWLLPLMLIQAGYLIYRASKVEAQHRLETLASVVGFLLILGAGTGLAHLHANPSLGSMPSSDLAGGVLGQLIADPLLNTTGALGATLFLLATFLTGLSFFTGLSWLRVMDVLGALVLNFFGSLGKIASTAGDWFAGRRAKAHRDVTRKADSRRKRGKPKPRIEPQVLPTKEQTSKRVQKEAQRQLFKSLPAGALPPLELLDEPPEHGPGYSKEDLEALSRQVELKLADFGIVADVVAVHPGPVITRFELLPAAGVKGSQVANLAKDLARGLSVVSVRIVDVIPGKSVIGLEIPNVNRQIVYLSEILRSNAYEKSASPLTLALGKGISGRAKITDIAKMPHLLVAGTTGSGKSVAVNSMIISLLFKSTPEQVRMIMIDPKMLELSVYDGIPHLLAPVVTDMKEAANALRWCVAEMERRYRLMAALGVRNLSGYNNKVKDAINKKQPLPDPLFKPLVPDSDEEIPTLTTLPVIVVVIDEFADMMMIVGKKVEELIARLAQKARAAGIHLILATQRPSVDVITGLIKANIPTRIAFQVSSKIDSRTILDQGGAEQLLGHGDMLFLPPGTALPDRVHGAFVDDHEVSAVANYLRTHGSPDYINEVLNDTQMTSDGQLIGATGLPEKPPSDTDELYDQAIAFVTRTRKASISSVQRQLRIGYNRAARIIEDMEMAGVVSPPEHNGAREVLAPPPPED